MICFPFLRQLGVPDVFFPGAPACTWNCMAPLSSFSPSIWRPWRFLHWSPCLHLKLYDASLVFFSINLAPLTFSFSLEPLLALDTAWRPSRPFLRQFGAPDVYFPWAPACTWHCMAPLSSFFPSTYRPLRFFLWSPCLHLKLNGTPLALFSVILAPLTFSSLEPLLALKLHGSPLVLFSVNMAPLTFFFSGNPACTWNCMASLSSFSPAIWRPWRWLPWSPACTWNCMAPLSSFSPSIWRPWLFFSLEPLLVLETAWRPSRPYLRQFGAPDVDFPGAPACTWNCMAPLSSFSPSIPPPRFFFLWSPCLHLKLHGAPDVYFPGAPACTWNCMAPLSSFSPSIPPPTFFFSGTPAYTWNCMAPLTFTSLEPLFALETAWRPSRPFLCQFGAPDVFFPGAPACTWSCMAPLSSCWFNFPSFFFSFLLPLSSFVFFLFPFFSSFSLFSRLSRSFPFLFSFFLALLFWHRGARAPKAPPPTRPWNV